MIKIITTLVLGCACASAWAQEATVALGSTTGNSLTPGEVVTLDLTGSNFALALDGGGINVSFNPEVLTLESVAVNTAVFDLPISNGTINNATGNLSGVDFFAFFNPSPVGNFDIASLTFKAGEAGSANLGLSVDSSFPFAATTATGNVLQLDPGIDFQFQTQKLTVSNMVAPVPEPPTLWLLAGVALAALSMRRFIPTGVQRF